MALQPFIEIFDSWQNFLSIAVWHVFLCIFRLYVFKIMPNKILNPHPVFSRWGRFQLKAQWHTKFVLARLDFFGNRPLWKVVVLREKGRKVCLKRERGGFSSREASKCQNHDDFAVSQCLDILSCAQLSECFWGNTSKMQVIPNHHS